MCVPFEREGNDKLCPYGGSVVKNPPAMQVAGVPGSERAPGEETGNPLQYSCLEKSMDREALWATVPGVAKESDRNEQLNSNLIRTKNMPSSVPDTRQS